MIAPKKPMLILILVLIAGCGGGGDSENAAETSAENDELAEAAADTANNFNFIDTPHLQKIDMGQYEAFWPSGCGRTRSRVIEENADTKEIIAAETTCDCFGRKDFGTKVTVYLKLPDGSIPGPENVTAGIESVVKKLRLNVFKQLKAERDGMEGVAAFCTQSDGIGAAWLEGYIYQGKILLTMAWGPDDSLFSNEEIIQFMGSVRFVD